jgi:hypothetical protein
MLAPTGLETTTVYMMWFSSISHPYIITPPEDVHIQRPSEQEALDEIVAEEQGDQHWVDMTRRLGCIRGHVLGIIGGVVVDQGSAACESWLQFYKGFMEGKFIVVGGDKGSRGATAT